MFIDLTSVPFDECLTVTRVVDDSELLGSLLDDEPIGEFTYTVECNRVDGGLNASVSVKGKVLSRCDLCGVSTEAECSMTMDELFTEADPEFDRIRNGYDLDRFVEDCIVFSQPRHVLCKPDCKGVCLRCGADLNKTQCKCKENPIGERNPFGALQDIIINGGAKNGSTKM